MRFSIGLAFSPAAHYVPLARAADEAGFHAVAVSDHVVNVETLRTPYPYTADGSRRWQPFTPWLDPWVAIGAMAAVTTRLRFFTNVYVLPMRNPFLVAKAVSTAAVLSGNRVTLGIGMGWCQEEFELMEQPFASGASGPTRCSTCSVTCGLGRWWTTTVTSMTCRASR